MAETFEEALWASHKAFMGHKPPDCSSCLLLHCGMKRDPEGKTYNTLCYTVPLYYIFYLIKYIY